MPTPDDVYSGINQRMQDAMRRLREGGDAVSNDLQGRLGGSLEPAQRGVAGMNPVTSIMSVGQQAIGVAENIGGRINTPGVREWANDGLINGLAGTNPITAPLVLGVQGSRLLNAQSGKPSSEVKPSPSGRPQASGTKITVDGKQYDTGYHSQEITELRNQNPGGGNAAQSQSTDPAKSSFIPATGRDVGRQSPSGVEQKGTSTSPKPMTMDDANKLLSGGYKVENPYSSNQLPYTQSSPYAGKGNAEIYNPETLHQHDNDVDYVSLSKDIYKDQSGVELATRNGGMKADYKQMDVNPGEKVPEEVTNWANRTMADNSDAKMARRRAFLDAKGSMQGLRDSEAVQGITYHKGNHYIADGKGGDSLTKVENKDDMRTYKSGAEGAQQIRDKYVNALTSKGDSVEYQTDAPAPVPGAVLMNSDIDKSQLDTQDMMQYEPKKSIIGNDTPYTSANPATLYR